MPTVSFNLRPDDIVRFHDAISCLTRFSDLVGLEAHQSKLVLTALDSSKTAYGAISLREDGFLQSYKCSGDDSDSLILNEEASFACQIHCRVLLSIFKGRGYDAKEKETPIERCEVRLQDQPTTAECRLIVNMICRHGMKKTYKLTYDSAEIMHALFDESAAKNSWTIGARVLKTFCEYFGAKKESLDLFYDGNRAVFTSYSDRKIKEEENLSKPLQTSIAIDTTDFEHYVVEEDRHVAINMKFFKAIVTHADQLRTTVAARYSRATSPLQLAYGDRGMSCEFTLMTIGAASAASAPAKKPPRNTASTAAANNRPTKPTPTPTESRSRNSQAAAAMPPPSQQQPPPPAVRSFVGPQPNASQRSARLSPPPPRATVDHESLFVSNEDEDELERRWGERNYEGEDDEMGWDAAVDNDAFVAELRRPLASNAGSTRNDSAAVARSEVEGDDVQRIAPTQRISQIKGLFD